MRYVPKKGNLEEIQFSTIRSHYRGFMEEVALVEPLRIGKCLPGKGNWKWFIVIIA